MTGKKKENKAEAGKENSCEIAKALGLCPVASLKNTQNKKPAAKRAALNELPCAAVNELEVAGVTRNEQLELQHVQLLPEQVTIQEDIPIIDLEALEKPTTSAASRKRKIELFKADTVNVLPKPANVIDTNPKKAMANRLEHFLSSSYAYKWIINEWFDSYMNKCLLGGKNSFENYLDTMLPKLKTRQLTRMQWGYLRPLFGKSHRFSNRFVRIERVDLERRRSIVRLLQSKNMGCLKELDLMAGIPDTIPSLLPKGTLVCAIVRNPFQGLHYGTVLAHDPINHCYNIRLFTPGLGEASIPDYELISMNYTEMSTIQTPVKHTDANNEPYYQFKIGCGEHINGYAVRELKGFLDMKRTVELHAEKLQELVDMNNEAQEMLQSGWDISWDNDCSSSDGNDEPETNTRRQRFINDFQRRYAGLLLNIEKFDRHFLDQIDFIYYFTGDLEFSTQINDGICGPNELYLKCSAAANALLKPNNCGKIKSSYIFELIKNMTLALKLIQALCFNHSAVLVLESVLDDMKKKIHPRNAHMFEEGIIGLMQNIRLCVENTKLAFAKVNSIRRD